MLLSSKKLQVDEEKVKDTGAGSQNGVIFPVGHVLENGNRHVEEVHPSLAHRFHLPNLRLSNTYSAMSLMSPFTSKPATLAQAGPAAPNALGVEAMFQQIMDAVHKSVCDVFSEPTN